MKKSRMVLLAILALAVAAALAWTAWHVALGRTGAPKARLQLDLRQPDALIVSQSLAALPADLLKIPLAKDLLSEDFVFFYEQQPEWLSLKGALRRIAYEHELSWSDALLRSLLDEPAELAFWRGNTGAMQHWLIAARRGKLAALLGEAAKLKFADKGLTQAGEVSGATVYALDYGTRQLLFAARGERVVVLSDAGMALDDKGALDPAAARILKDLLADGSAHALYSRSYALPEAAPGVAHRVAVSTRFWGMGYQRLFPAVQALGFDFGAQGWQTALLMQGGANAAALQGGQTLFAAIPHDAAACAVLPLDWAALPAVLAQAEAPVKDAATALAAQMQGPAGICWFASSRLQAPLLLAQAKPGSAATLQEPLATLFDAMLQGDGDSAPTAVQAAGASGWQLQWKNPDALQAQLMRQGDMLAFSPDAKLVARSLQVQAKQQPALADRLGHAPGQAVAWLAPAPLSTLAQKEARASLPQPDEASLRRVADERLMPRLQAVARHPPKVLRLPPDAPQGTSSAPAWQPLLWQDVAAAP